jgi:hypothetical protein
MRASENPAPASSGEVLTGGRPMPITPFLGDQTFDCETKRIMGVAFEMAYAAVERDWGDGRPPQFGVLSDRLSRNFALTLGPSPAAALTPGVGWCPNPDAFVLF